MYPLIHQNTFSIPYAYAPTRIVSLVPSQTELLYDLGSGDRVAGITKFCVHPTEWFQSKLRIGGTKTVDIEKVKQLQPDLIIANKEENVKEQIEELAAICPVYVSDINTLNDALKMIQQVGILTGTQLKAALIIKNITTGFSQLQHQQKANLSTTYLIWRKPYMAAGGDTFINDMLQCCGLQNTLANRLRYPAITTEDLQKTDCQLLLLSSEPYPFKQKHVDELQACLPQTKIMLVDGEMFSWYGSRLLKAADYFTRLMTEIQT